MFRYQHDQPGVHELMRELRALMDEYPDRVLVGETDEIAFYGNGDDELHLAFNFPLMRTQRLTPFWIRENQKTRLAELPLNAWPCNTLGNHNSSRVYSRYGDGEHDDALARLHLMLMLTLKGTPFLYNGEEIGMRDTTLTDLSQIRDVLGLFYYDMAVRVGGMSPEKALETALKSSRDRNRTPNQWANAANGGFSPEGVTPWLPVNPNYAQGVNVADQQQDPTSLLNFYCQAIAMRQRTPALIDGDYQVLNEEAQDYLAFVRANSEQQCLVVLNFSSEPQTVTFDLPVSGAHLIFSSHARAQSEDSLSSLSLAPFETYVAQLN